MRSHSGAHLFFVLGAYHALLHLHSANYTPQHQKPATKR